MAIADELINLFLEPLIDNFSKKFLIEDNECWVWCGRTDKGNLPIFNLKGKPKSARRVAHWLIKGDITTGLRLYLPSTCNPLCVNPHHMLQASISPNLHNNKDAKNA